MLKLEYKPYTLDFKFEARTSRGSMNHHEILLIKVFDDTRPDIQGFGEVAPLSGLSEEKLAEAEECIQLIQERIAKYDLPLYMSECLLLASTLCPEQYSSVIFGLETAFLDLLGGGKKEIFKGPFTEGKKLIPINGLIWMGDPESMKNQAKEKIDAGFKCIKMKVGAEDFLEELKVIETIRGVSENLIIRLDANGVFKNNEALKKLSMLAEFNIHSIEQPILARQLEAMQLICKKSPISVALDEELIGITEKSQKVEMLRFLRPSYIILKPTLHGGIDSCMDWISIANEMNIGYWVTSALESNIGLNAVAQFADFMKVDGFQGLGTGMLYLNNIVAPLEIVNGGLMLNPTASWIDPF